MKKLYRDTPSMLYFAMCIHVCVMLAVSAMLCSVSAYVMFLRVCFNAVFFSSGNWKGGLNIEQPVDCERWSIIQTRLFISWETFYSLTGSMLRAFTSLHVSVMFLNVKSVFQSAWWCCRLYGHATKTTFVRLFFFFFQTNWTNFAAEDTQRHKSRCSHSNIVDHLQIHFQYLEIYLFFLTYRLVFHWKWWLLVVARLFKIFFSFNTIECAHLLL